MLRILGKWLRQALVAGLIVSLTAYGVVVVACLPRTVQVELVETRRVAFTKRDAERESSQRVVLTRTREGESLEFRNDNTNWGFPPYFKFNAETIQSKAERWLALEPNPKVFVQFYGFRIGERWSVPNVVSLDLESEYEDTAWPWAGILAMLHGLGAIAVIRWIARRRQKRAMRDETPAEM